LFFDFYLPDYKAVIEFDGIHHFKPIHGMEKLKQQRYKDGRKNTYCRKNKIPILRIPYWQAHEIQAIICKWFDDNF
jgi:very-short-patch-repair endonuclease